jgi:ribosomal protein L16 Arg81 hydroxylase
MSRLYVARLLGFKELAVYKMENEKLTALVEQQTETIEKMRLEQQAHNTKASHERSLLIRNQDTLIQQWTQLAELIRVLTATLQRSDHSGA